MPTFEQYPVRPELAARFDSMVEMRRDLHRHPELGFQEVRTSGIVMDRLRSAGLDFRSGIAKTGISTVVAGTGGEGRTVLFRADMDALPIQEETAAEYRSVHDETMHACGHDGHTTILLHTLLEAHTGSARPKPDVKYIFQPAEEGPGGAKPMIEGGVLRSPDVEAAFGLHLWNKLEAGKVAVTSGDFMAAADEFEIRIVGKGGHGAYPHDAVDAVVVGAHMVVALQTLVSRETDPTKTAVVSIGAFEGGRAFNILAEQVRMVGTLRTFDEEVRAKLIRRLHELVEGTAALFGARAELQFIDGYPATVNDPRMADFVAEIAGEVVGAENVVRDLVSMGGEDMSFFLREVPGCYFFLGSMDRSRGLDASHHNPRFDFDEGVMPIGAEIFLRLQDRYLDHFRSRLPWGSDVIAARGATILSAVRLPVRAALGAMFGVVSRVVSRATAMFTAAFCLLLCTALPASAIAGLLPGLPPLRHFFVEGWVRDDGVSFESAGGRWETVSVDPVIPVSGELARFEEWRWFVAEDGLRSRAADRAEDWLRLGELELGSRRIEASKQLGGRFRISSFTGYQASSQRMIRAEYEMGRGLVIRSEARERGESRIVVEREQTFR